MSLSTAIDYATLADDIKRWARELGFADVGIAGTDLGKDEGYLERWLADGHHGEMDYMARHGTRRSRPAELEPGTLRVVSVRMDYVPPGTNNAWDVIHHDDKAYAARYGIQKGREWRSVQDTTYDPIINARRPIPWSNYQRSFGSTPTAA